MRGLLVSLICAAAVMISIRVEAEGVPRVEKLTPETLTELGFTASPYPERGALGLTLVGPATDVQGCKPSSSGVALLDDSNKQLLASVTDLDAGATKPEQFARLTLGENRMLMWFDYLACPPGVYPTRYLIESVLDFDPANR